MVQISVRPLTASFVSVSHLLTSVYRWRGWSSWSTFVGACLGDRGTRGSVWSSARGSAQQWSSLQTRLSSLCMSVTQRLYHPPSVLTPHTNLPPTSPAIPTQEHGFCNAIIVLPLPPCTCSAALFKQTFNTQLRFDGRT